MNQREKADFTQGSILNKLIPFMMPVLGALVLQAAYGEVDLLVVGRFGTTAGLYDLCRIYRLMIRFGKMSHLCWQRTIKLCTISQLILKTIVLRMIA